MINILIQKLKLEKNLLESSRVEDLKEDNRIKERVNKKRKPRCLVDTEVAARDQASRVVKGERSSV